MEKTIDDWRRIAIQIQDACNLSGILISFTEWCAWARAHGMGTGAINNHPISTLFADKVNSLCPLSFANAYTWAQEGGELPTE